VWVGQANTDDRMTDILDGAGDKTYQELTAYYDASRAQIQHGWVDKNSASTC
jgi:hypothetical protein